MWDLWWTKWHCFGFSSSTSVSPANSHSTDCYTLCIIRGWYNRPVSGRSTKWTQSHPTASAVSTCSIAILLNSVCWVVQSCRQPSRLSFDSDGRSFICHLVALIHKESVNKSLIPLIRLIVSDTGRFQAQSKQTHQRLAVSTSEWRRIRTRADYVRRRRQRVLLSALLSDGECGHERTMSAEGDSVSCCQNSSLDEWSRQSGKRNRCSYNYPW
jgi:hypothetical protein